MLATLVKLATTTGEIRKMLTYCSWSIAFEIEMFFSSFQRVFASGYFFSITSITFKKNFVSFYSNNVSAVSAP